MENNHSWRRDDFFYDSEFQWRTTTVTTIHLITESIPIKIEKKVEKVVIIDGGGDDY